MNPLFSDRSRLPALGSASGSWSLQPIEKSWICCSLAPMSLCTGPSGTGAVVPSSTVLGPPWRPDQERQWIPARAGPFAELRGRTTRWRFLLVRSHPGVRHWDAQTAPTDHSGDHGVSLFLQSSIGRLQYDLEGLRARRLIKIIDLDDCAPEGTADRPDQRHLQAEVHRMVVNVQRAPAQADDDPHSTGFTWLRSTLGDAFCSPREASDPQFFRHQGLGRILREICCSHAAELLGRMPDGDSCGSKAPTATGFNRRETMMHCINIFWRESSHKIAASFAAAG